MTHDAPFPGTDLAIKGKERAMERLRWAALLLLAAGALGEWHEEWLDAAWQDGRLLAWGRQHVWSGGLAGGGEEWGFPAGVVAVLPGEPPWATLADGRLVRLDGDPAVWQVERACWDACGDGAAGAWLLGPGGARHVALRGPSSPEVLEQHALPRPATGGELRLDDGLPWLRLGQELWRLCGAGWRPAGSLPEAARDWLPWRGRLLLVDGRGVLLSAPGDTGLPAAGPQSVDPGSTTVAWMRVRAGEDGLWLQDVKGRWWWADQGRDPRLCHPDDAGTWLPVQRGLLLQQTAEERRWWRETGGEWCRSLRLPRPAPLLDRLTRWTSRWRLSAEGVLERGEAGGWRELARLPGAQALAPAGAGPLVLTPAGLEAWSDEGRHLGSLALAGIHGAESLEDHLLAATADGLASVDCNGEVPALLHLLPLSGVETVTAAPLWAVLRRGGLAWLVDRRQPHQPLLVDSRPLPEDLRGLRLVEDRLYLLGDGGVRVWSCREGRLEEAVPDLPGGGACWALSRGADRLLLLAGDGRLRQWRLEDNLPVEEEWSRDLEVAGNLRLAGDTLLVTGGSGWQDVLLPPLPQTGGRRVERLRGPAAGMAGRKPAPRVAAVAGGLAVHWSGEASPPPRLALFDLAGRRLLRVDVDGAGRAFLPLAGLPAGRYVLEELDTPRPRAHGVTWVP